MFTTLVNAFKVKDIRRKIFISLFLLLIYRVGCWMPIPGIEPGIFRSSEFGKNDSLLGLMSAIGGGALQNGALLALGIAPYINSSIIMQLLTVAIPKLEQWSKQGEEGRRKINMWTRVLTLILALAQAIGIVINWNRTPNAISAYMFGSANLAWLISIFVVIFLVAGAAFTMWIGERITELGIGNGISLLIFVGILATAAQAILFQFKRMITDDPIASTNAMWGLIGFLIMVLFIFFFIVFIDLSERRIPIQYAKQIKGRKMYGGQSTHIPIKVNASGVLPIIFAMAIITFPQLICQLFWPNSGFYIWYRDWLGAGKPIYVVVLSLLIFAFAFFYAQIQFNPEEVARNIQQYGGFIPGIRPGQPTAQHLAKISKRLTFFGATFLALIVLIPSVILPFVLKDNSLTNAFSATGLLIVVSVALEFDKQLQGQLMMKHYKGFLK
ncbi:MAG: preprotein translocase subunit SecY [Firmicutes bacterium]|nr:preprotein translocase subunit SecY [Bacillota bacterium]